MIQAPVSLPSNAVSVDQAQIRVALANNFGDNRMRLRPSAFDLNTITEHGQGNAGSSSDEESKKRKSPDSKHTKKRDGSLSDASPTPDLHRVSSGVKSDSIDIAPLRMSENDGLASVTKSRDLLPN